jgi:hypothetical protein
MLCVLDELLQVYAITVLGVFVIRNVAATKIAIPLIRNKRFMFVLIPQIINVNCYSVLKLNDIIVYGLRPPRRDHKPVDCHST